MQDTYYQERDQILLIMKKIYHDITLAPKKYHHYTFLKIKDITKDFPYSTKIKYILLTHSTLSRSFFLGYSCPMLIRKQPQCCTIKP